MRLGMWVVVKDAVMRRDKREGGGGLWMWGWKGEGAILENQKSDFKTLVCVPQGDSSKNASKIFPGLQTPLGGNKPVTRPVPFLCSCARGPPAPAGANSHR